MSNLERQRNTKHKGRQTRDTLHMAIRDIYKARSIDILDLSCCAAADFCALLATLARACVFAASNSWTYFVNQVPVQPNEHRALDLTCKHVAAQVTNEVGER